MKLKPETVMELGVPSFIGKRQQHLYASASTEMTFSATADHEKAGFMVYYDEYHFYFLAQSVNNGKPVLQLFKGNQKTKGMDLITETSLAGKVKNVQLKIEAKGEVYDFYYATSANKWQKLQGDLDAKYVSTRNAGGFTGCFFAFYATSSGKPSTNSAAFKYLTYSGNDPMFK